MPTVKLTRWAGPELPARGALETIFRNERLSPNWWSNGPGDRYAAHSHPFHKVLYCARGSIRFILDETEEAVDLAPGDRLDLPEGTSHAAAVGPQGVTCVEAARR